MDRKEKNFNRNINNYHRYCLYGKEARTALKSVKKLEEGFDLSRSQTEQFFNQLIKLCTCKSDNVLLRNLAQDLVMVKSNFRKASNSFRQTLNCLNTQLIQISDQFTGLKKLESKYRDAHQNRTRYERRPKNFAQLISRAFSFKAQNEDDFVNSFHNLENDYLDNYTDKPIDHKLAKLIKDESNLERSLVGHCLNQELAIVVRIRKLVKIFAENQIIYQNDLNSLFGQLLSMLEQNIPMTILSLNNKELDEYFRPKRKHHLLPQFYSNPTATTSKVPENVSHSSAVEQNSCFQRANATNPKRSYSLDSAYKTKVFNKILASKSPNSNAMVDQPKAKNSLYYGNLCSLNDKVCLNLKCDLCSREDDQNKQANQEAMIRDEKDDNQQEHITTSPKVKNPFNETSYHKCKLDHIAKGRKVDVIPNYLIPDDVIPNQLPNIDLTNNEAIQPSASAPPAEQWPTSVFCNDLCKVEAAAVNFLNNYRNFRNQMENLERTFKLTKDDKGINDQLTDEF